MNAQQAKWEKHYATAVNSIEKEVVADVLMQNLHLLPNQGVGLDLACGLGANSFLLARSGLSVVSWDFSANAIRRLRENAQRQELAISAEVRDVINFPPEPEQFDVIVVSNFLDREIASAISDALKPSGLLFYQTYCQVKTDKIGPQNPDYLLADNELLKLFASLRVRVYREESVLGNHSQGWRNKAMLVAEKNKAF